MDKSKWRGGLVALLMTVGAGVPISAASAQSSPCGTPAAGAIHEVREQAMRREAEDLQRILDRTVGAAQADAVEPGCLQGIMSGGLGRGIKLPTLSGLLDGIIDAASKAAISAFCSRVNTAVSRVESVVGHGSNISVTDMVMNSVGFNNAFGLNIPEVQYNVGIGGSHAGSGGYPYYGTINPSRY